MKGQAYWKRLNFMDKLDVIRKLVSIAQPFLKEVCDKELDKLFFNTYFSEGELRMTIETEKWIELVKKAGLLGFDGSKFATLANVNIPLKGSCVVSKAHFVVGERGNMYIFFLRLIKTRYDKNRFKQYATVTECRIVKDDGMKFDETFCLLAKNNCSFPAHIAEHGLYGVYNLFHQKKAEFQQLQQFKDMFDSINFCE